MKRCGAQSPETGAVCILPEQIHLSHSDGRLSWDNTESMEEFARRPKKRDSGATKYRKGGTPRPQPETITKIEGMSARTAPERHVNPLSTGIPPEAVVAWSKDDWVSETTATLRVFLNAHPGVDWTSPEDFWPLIDSPQGDMRAMSLVIQSALRSDWIHEVGSRRLRDTYCTRDGVEFAMNKLVPIYRATS